MIDKIKTETEYQGTVKRMMTIFHVEEGGSEAEELTTLIAAIKDYEDQHIHLPSIN